MTMGEKILNMRKARGWSQEELAERIGVTRQAVSRWESGAAKPDADKLIAVCDLFGVSADYLLRDIPGGQEQPLPAIVTQKTGSSPWLSWGMTAFGAVTLFVLRILASINRTYIVPAAELNLETGEEIIFPGYYTGFRYYLTSNGLEWLAWLAVSALLIGAGRILWLKYRARKNTGEDAE